MEEGGGGGGGSVGGQLPYEFSYEYWLTGPTDVVTLSCLMPNGNIILLQANSNATFAEIKEVRLNNIIIIIISYDLRIVLGFVV